MLAAAQVFGYPGRTLAAGAGQKDLAATEDEGIGGAQPFFEPLALFFRECTDEDWRFHKHYCSSLTTCSGKSLEPGPTALPFVRGVVCRRNPSPRFEPTIPPRKWPRGRSKSGHLADAAAPSTDVELRRGGALLLTYPQLRARPLSLAAPSHRIGRGLRVAPRDTAGHHEAVRGVTTREELGEGILRWACLDSNQGPLPYQSGCLPSAASRRVRTFG